MLIQPYCNSFLMQSFLKFNKIKKINAITTDFFANLTIVNQNFVNSSVKTVEKNYTYHVIMIRIILVYLN